MTRRRLYANEDDAYDAKRQQQVDAETLHAIQAQCSHTDTWEGYCLNCGADTVPESES